MNKNIKLAVAGAVLALSASAANAGIVIPAGDWTLDIGGNVNAFSTWTKSDGTASIKGAAATVPQGGTNTKNDMSTGLLPNFLSVSGSTRQNDIDVAFTISIQPGISNTTALSGASGGLSATNQNNRQSFMTFGDKSWGSIKVGKDLGIFASDAILSDMTLLGVGVGGGGAGGGNTTLGRIGAGYIYADWKPQFAYTTPNFNGFQATVGVTQSWNQYSSAGAVSLASTNRGGASPAYEAKASYSFNADTLNGKVWVSGISQRIDGATVVLEDKVAYAGDLGANLNVANFGLTGYYYGGSGIGTTGQFMDGYAASGKTRDSNGGYVQLTYKLPTATKLGVSYGVSQLDQANGEGSNTTLVKENEATMVGLYHPLTKHLNLVAEYAYNKAENHAGASNKAYSGSLGAILFF